MPAPVRRPRLMGLNNPKPSVRRQPRKSGDSRKPHCPQCKSEELEENDNLLICKNCFIQVGESNIVAEVTFEENVGGRATVQGGTVGENARHAKTMGPAAYRKVGGGEKNTLADNMANGRKILGLLCPKLGIQEPVQVQAESIWSLAAGINFSAGRRNEEVAAACLYAACRRRRDNQILLMDIAELLKINVFRLGEVYKDMCRELYLVDESVGHQYLQELEPLIKKYCDKLQFADKTKVVAEDALKIIRRMNRDWIVAGRHPAGLCGACIILAARMNNFQRSVREVVYVSKVADVTIAQRVKEFRKTKSAALTVEQFRKYANKIKHQHNPPSVDSAHNRAEAMAKRKRKRDEHLRLLSEQPQDQQHGQSSLQPIDLPNDVDDASSRLTSAEPDCSSPDEALEQSESRKRRRIEGPQLLTPPTTQLQSQQEPTRLSATYQPDLASQEYAETPFAANGRTRRERGDSLNALTDSMSPIEDTSRTENEARERQPTGKSPTTMSDSSQTGPRVDPDGFTIPALPQHVDPANSSAITPAWETSAVSKRGRWRPRKEEQPQTIDISVEELEEEDKLEMQIEQAMENAEVQESLTEVEKAKKKQEAEEARERARILSEQQQRLDAEKIKARRTADGVSHYFKENSINLTRDYADAEALAEEFMDDEEVHRCLLNPEEVRIKEQIWVAHNEDWLRKQAEKEMLAKVAKATNNTSGRGRKSRDDNKAMKQRKKRSKIGDGSVLTESSTPIETPADAARAMLERRAPLKSQHVDFSALQRIYSRDNPSSRAGSMSPEEEGSRSQDGMSVGSREPSANPAPDRPGALADDPRPSEMTSGKKAGHDVTGNESEADDGAGEDADEDDPETQGDAYDGINDDPDYGDEDEEADRAINKIGNDEFGAVFDDMPYGEDDYEEYE